MSAWLTVVAVGLGTNLYYYTAFEPGMSHPISFGLLCGAFFFADRWYWKATLMDLAWMGFLAGWAVVVRPLNALYFLPLLFWNAGGSVAIRERLRFLLQRVRQLPVGIVALLVGLLPQLLYWNYVAGSPVYYSYGEEGFKWSEPHVWEGLFSYKKGWFVYTPLAFFAGLGFLSLLRKSNRLLLWPILGGTTLLVYITFCWHQWYYGGSFGCRPLIESFVLMAFPLAAGIQYVMQSRYRAARAVVIGLLAGCIALNLFQSYQFSFGTIHYADMNRAYYWRVFGKIRATEEDRKLLEAN